MPRPELTLVRLTRTGNLPALRATPSSRYAYPHPVYSVNLHRPGKDTCSGMAAGSGSKTRSSYSSARPLSRPSRGPRCADFQDCCGPDSGRVACVGRIIRSSPSIRSRYQHSWVVSVSLFLPMLVSYVVVSSRVSVEISWFSRCFAALNVTVIRGLVPEGRGSFTSA